MAQQYQEFASDFTGSIATLQQETCQDFIPDELPLDISCPTCTPNPEAVVPDWTARDSTQPFLNEQNCLYSITIETQYSDVGGDQYVERVKEYAPLAARRLLRYYNKLETDIIVDLLVNGTDGSGPVIKATEWYLPFEPNSKLKILFTIPAYNFDGISPDSEDPSAFNQESPPSDSEVTLDLIRLDLQLDRLTQVFTVYGRLQAAFRNIDDGSFIVENSNKEFIIGSDKDDMSLVSQFASLKQVINTILSDNSYAEFGSFLAQIKSLSNLLRKANYIKFGYNEQYVVDKITIIEEGCPDFIIEGDKLLKYTDEQPLNNPTIIAYLSKLEDMYNESLAIDASEWTEFLLKYTYPTLTINYGKNTLFDDEEALAECIAQAIADYGATITNRALDELFDLPTAIADRLNKIMCVDRNDPNVKTTQQLIDELIEKQNGQLFEKIAKAVNNSEPFKVFTILMDFKRRIKFHKDNNSKARRNIVELFDNLLDDYGFCGMLALIQALLNCILGGFSYEEILRKIVESSLKGFTPLQMVKFLEFLPSDKRLEVLNKIDDVLKNNDLISGFSNTLADPNNTVQSIIEKGTEQYNIEAYLNSTFDKSDDTLIDAFNKTGLSDSSSTTEEFATNPTGTEEADKYWEESTENVVALLETAPDITATNADTTTNTDIIIPEGVSGTIIGPSQEVVDEINDRTNEYYNSILSQDRSQFNKTRPQLGKGSPALGQLQSIIMNAYIEAILELVDAEEIYSIILKFPGVKILAQLINAARCPRPDQTGVTFLNFLNTLEIEWCKMEIAITFPQITLPNFSAFLSALWKAFSQVVAELIIKLIYSIITEILLKLIEILLTSLCNLLSTIGNAILAGHNIGTELLDMFRETFGCPPIETAEQEEALLEAIAQIFGGQATGGGNGFTTQEVASVLQNVSVSLTAYELSDLLKGKLSSDRVRYLKNILRASDPKFSSIFPDESSISSMFQTMGNLIPDDILQEFEDRAGQFVDSLFPANLSVCGTPESISRFNDLRERILSDRGLSSDEIKTQLDGMKNRADENLQFLTDLGTKGLGNTTGEKLVAAMLGSDALTDPTSAITNQNDPCNNSVYGSPFSSEIVKNVQSMANDTLFNSLRTVYLNDLFKEPDIFDGIGKKPIAFLNAVLSDKNGRDFVKHNKRADDIFFRLYNSDDQLDDINESFPPILKLNKESQSKNYFPTYVSKLTQTTLNNYSTNNDLIFENKTQPYELTQGRSKRYIFGKKEDFSLTADAFSETGKKHNLLYSQFVLSGSTIASNNLTRLFLSTETGVELKVKTQPDSDLGIGTNSSEKEILINHTLSEQVDVTFQSKYRLDEGITELKNTYLPAVITNSPQADCFTNYMNEKINIPQYTTPVNCDIELFNSISDRVMKYTISTLTSDENSYKFGYEWSQEKITQEDIDIDSDTLQRKTENPRVIFLDYEKYGGTEENPAVYIKPVKRTGWLGVADSIIPELGCEPATEKIVDFDELNSLITHLQSSLPDDPKLSYDADCRELLPYVKPLSSQMAANLQVAIVTTMRVYISEAILRCIPMFDKYVVSFDKIIDELYLDYILKKMQDGMLEQGKGLFNVKSDEYYLYFLEQCVQVVSRKVVDGEIQLNEDEQSAFDTINQMIQNFYFIKEKDYAFLKEKLQILNNLRELALKMKSSLRTISVISPAQEVKFALDYALFVATLKNEAVTYPKLADVLQKIESIAVQYFTNPYNFALFKDLKNEIVNVLIEISMIQKNYIGSLDPILSKVMEDFIVKKDKVKIPSLKKLRKEMVLEAIRQTREEAKIIARIILKEEILTMSSKFAANVYSIPSITNIRKYFLDTNTNVILPKSKSVRYFDVASDTDDNPLYQLNQEIVDAIDNDEIKIDLRDNSNGYFILERYIKIQDRVVPLSGTTIPQELYNRPSNLNGVINVYDFKNWIATLSEQTKETEIYKLFGDLTVTGSESSGYALSGSTIGLKYGLRLSFIPPDRYFAGSTDIGGATELLSNFSEFGAPINLSGSTTRITNSEIALKEKAYQLGNVLLDGGVIPQNSQFIIPVVSGEIDLIDDKLGNFDPDNGINKYNHDCLVKELYDSNQFRFLFYYIFPIQKYLSALAAYISEYYVKLIGTSEDEWICTPLVTFKENNLTFYRTKEHCQIFFETFYNWEDFNYKPIKLKKLLEGADTLLERANVLLRPIGPLVLTDWRVHKRNPFDQDGNECDTFTEEDK